MFFVCFRVLLRNAALGARELSYIRSNVWGFMYKYSLLIVSRPPDRRPFEPLAAIRNMIDNAEIACDTDSSAPSIGRAQFSIGLGTSSCWYGLLASITLESVETVQPFCRDPDS